MMGTCTSNIDSKFSYKYNKIKLNCKLQPPKYLVYFVLNILSRIMATNFNISYIKTSDNGVWQGEDPLHFAFPLLILQTILVIFTSRVVAFVLAPLRQPTVIAEILVRRIFSILLSKKLIDITHNSDYKN